MRMTAKARVIGLKHEMLKMNLKSVFINPPFNKAFNIALSVHHTTTNFDEAKRVAPSAAPNRESADSDTQELRNLSWGK